MAPITPPERSGEGRATIGDRHALIRASPHSPGLLAPQAIVVERLPDESTPEEFLNNERRRVGRIHDLAEQLAADPAASNCPKVTIYGHAATDALELARQRRRRSGVAMRQASEISRFWSIEVSANGFSKAGGDAGLRLADLRSEDSASFQILDKVGRTRARRPGRTSTGAAVAIASLVCWSPTKLTAGPLCYSTTTRFPSSTRKV